MKHNSSFFSKKGLNDTFFVDNLPLENIRKKFNFETPIMTASSPNKLKEKLKQLELPNDENNSMAQDLKDMVDDLVNNSP